MRRSRWRQTLLALCVLSWIIGEHVPTWAATYYVDITNGADGVSCSTAQTIGTPKQHIMGASGGLACLSAGDTLLIRAGTYAEAIDSGSQTIPTGTSWANAPLIAAYPGETVQITRLGLWHAYIQYVIFDRLIIDGNNGGADEIVFFAGGVHDVRLQNSEIRNAGVNGVFISGVTNITLLTNTIHHTGWATSTGHCIYHEGATNTLIEGNEIYDCYKNGIQIYSGSYPTPRSDGTIVRGNRIHDCGLTDSSSSSGGIILGSGTGNVAYNNLIYGNKFGIRVDYHATQTVVANNTIYGQTATGLYVGAASGTDNTQTALTNNIVYGNGTMILDAGSGTTFTTNLCDTTGTGCASAGNPLFVNSSTGDFHLQAGSPAIDQGTTLATVTTDYAGVTRPQGSAYDIGAYEVVVSSGAAPLVLHLVQ
jgi:parallel beta-helix repeat protein